MWLYSSLGALIGASRTILNTVLDISLKQYTSQDLTIIVKRQFIWKFNPIIVSFCQTRKIKFNYVCNDTLYSLVLSTTVWFNLLEHLVSGSIYSMVILVVCICLLKYSILWNVKILFVYCPRNISFYSANQM